MNQKLLIIFVIVLLIVLVSFLIYNKKYSTDNFHEGNCDNLSTDVCEVYFGDTCRINPDNDTQCKYKCKFTPSDVYDSPEKSGDYGIVTQQVGDEMTYRFETEDVDGAYGSCFKKCRDIQHNQDIENSHCTIEDCKTECRNYVLRKVQENKKTQVRYESYPTNQISDSKYNEIKDTMISKMVSDNNYKEQIRDAIYGGDIDTKVSEQVDFKDETDKLKRTIDILLNLQNTGNNFIQQIDQMGSFQDKYSSKIESLLEEKRNSNNALDRKLLSMSEKIELLNKFYSDINTNFDSSPNEDVLKYYKTAQSLANGTKIFFTPVTYNLGTEALPNKKIFKNGAYLLNLEKDTGGRTQFLFIEPLKMKDDGSKEYCNPNNLECNYELIKGGNDRETDEDIAQASIETDIIGEKYPMGLNPQQKDFKHKKQAYFNVLEIKNYDDYNSIIIKTPRGSKNLVKAGDNVKYPFFVIESIELPGHLINITTKQSDGGNIKSIQLFPASNKGTEKFSVDNINAVSDSEQCN